MSYQNYEIEWQGIVVSICYSPTQWGLTSHIEVESIAPKHAPLPNTETGYRSHFVPIGTVETQYSNAREFVIAWLEERAQSED